MHHVHVHIFLSMLWFVLYVFMIDNQLYDDLKYGNHDWDHELNLGGDDLGLNNIESTFGGRILMFYVVFSEI